MEYSLLLKYEKSFDTNFTNQHELIYWTAIKIKKKLTKQS